MGPDAELWTRVQTGQEQIRLGVRGGSGGVQQGSRAAAEGWAPSVVSRSTVAELLQRAGGWVDPLWPYTPSTVAKLLQSRAGVKSDCRPCIPIYDPT